MKKLYLFLLGLCFSTFTYAGGFQVSLQGTKQLGMAHTGAATSLDNASLFFNPGAFSLTQGNQVTGTFSPILVNVSFLHAQTQTLTEKENSLGTPFALYASTQLKKDDATSALNRLRLGVGVYTPFGSQVLYPDGWVGRFITRTITLTSVAIQPTVGYQINERFGIGAGFVYALGNFELDRNLGFHDVDGEGAINLQGDGSGAGFNVGFYGRPTDAFSFGVSYRSQIKIELEEGDATFDVPQSLLDSGLIPAETTFSSEITLPSNLNIGIAYHFGQNSIVSAELNRVGWSSYDQLAFEFAQPVAGSSSSVSARNYQDHNIYRLGVQYGELTKVTLRAGLYYDTEVTDGTTITPETPDANRYGFTLGCTLQPTQNLDINLAYQQLLSEERTSTNVESGFTGTYTARAFIPSIGLNYSF